MGQTVRETKAETRHDPKTGEETGTVTTIFMQDGSKHVRTANAKALFPDRGPDTTEVHYDKEGRVISETTSVTFNDLGDHNLDNGR